MQDTRTIYDGKLISLLSDAYSIVCERAILAFANIQDTSAIPKPLRQISRNALSLTMAFNMWRFVSWLLTAKCLRDVPTLLDSMPSTRAAAIRPDMTGCGIIRFPRNGSRHRINPDNGRSIGPINNRISRNRKDGFEIIPIANLHT